MAQLHLRCFFEMYWLSKNHDQKSWKGGRKMKLDSMSPKQKLLCGFLFVCVWEVGWVVGGTYSLPIPVESKFMSPKTHKKMM